MGPVEEEVGIEWKEPFLVHLEGWQEWGGVGNQHSQARAESSVDCSLGLAWAGEDLDNKLELRVGIKIKTFKTSSGEVRGGIKFKKKGKRKIIREIRCRLYFKTVIFLLLNKKLKNYFS